MDDRIPRIDPALTDEHFEDAVHFNIEGHRLITRQVVEGVMSL